jgi:adenylate cyclase
MRFLFDNHVLDVGQRELRLGTEPVALEPLVFDLLAYLVANRDHVVTKDDLQDAVWSGRIVSESAVASSVAAARRAVGDSGEAQKAIRTIARKGFRFVGEVHEEAGPVLKRSEPTSAPLAVSDRPSIAVLAFANLSSDPEQEFLSDGMADDIITELSQDHSLFVIARNSSFAYKGRAVGMKQIASELGVRYVLEGSTRRNGGQIRVNAQLIDALNGTHIWARRYDRKVEAVFAVQDEITVAVTRAILPAVADAERRRAMRSGPDNLSAWEAWQWALWHWSKWDDFSNARDFLRRAVTLDPRFAAPHAMLAFFHLSEATLGVGPSSREQMMLAETEARTAIELDPGSGFAHAMLAWVYDHQGDRKSALAKAELAVSLNPNDPQGHLAKGRILVFSGQPAMARDSLDLALALDPHGLITPAALHHRAMGCYLERNYTAAEEISRRTIKAFPEFPRPYLFHAAALGQLGRPDEAQTALEAATEVSPSHFQYTVGSRPPYYRPEDHEHLLEGLRKAGWRG